MYKIYTTTVGTVRPVTVMVVARSPNHANMQAASLLTSRGLHIKEDVTFKWAVHRCDQPGAYIIKGVPDEEGEASIRGEQSGEA